MKLVQVVPRLPPPEEALGQAAVALSGEFRRLQGVEGAVLEAKPGVSELRADLDQLRPDAALLLHYVGYGYAKRGAPLSMLRTLERWLRRAPHRHLLVHFHEVASFGPPWRSSFWLAPFQRRIAARLARAATGSITSLERYQLLLHRLAPRARVVVLPIFSTIGEPDEMARDADRQQHLVLFASPGARRAVWQHHLTRVAETVTALALNKVVEIGSAPEGPNEVAGVCIERTGELGNQQVGRVLGRAQAAFFGYPLEYLDKSSAFAAACAHGVLPVCVGRRDRPGPAPGEGVRWASVEQLWGLGVEERSSIASRAREWYLGHDLARHAHTWLELLRA